MLAFFFLNIYLSGYYESVTIPGFGESSYGQGKHKEEGQGAPLI